jgi:hypothetical protein
MSALLVSLALLALVPPPSDRSDPAFQQRMQVGRIGAGVAFVLATGGLTVALRRLGRHARDAEHAARVERAYRELERELDSPPTQAPNPNPNKEP